MLPEMSKERFEGSGQVFAGTVPYAVLFVCSALLYWKTLGFGFITTWDDDIYVLNNVLIRGLTAEHLCGIMTTPLAGNYAPVQILSYSLDHLLWGLDPGGYHFSNFILHSINGCLVYACLKAISKNAVASFAAAALFLVHPVNVENVAWIAERKTLLAGLFFFLSLLSYLEFREKDRAREYILSLLLFAAGILSKTSVVVLPAVLLTQELFLAQGRSGSRRFYLLIPFFVLAAAGAAAVILIHLREGFIEQGALSAGVLFGTVYPTMMTVFWKYAGLLVWPVDLSGFYDTAVYQSFFRTPVVVSVIAWILLSVYIFRWTGRQVRFWYLWFWICLIPVSNLLIPLPVYFADRYMYLSGIGLFMICGLAITGTFERIKGLPGLRALAGPAVYTAVFLPAAFYAVLTYNRLEVWRNDTVFWEDTARRSPRMYVPHMNLGAAYEKNGRFEEAEREYLTALGIYEDPKVLLNLRIVRIKMGKEQFR